MRNLKRKLALASFVLCGSVALGLGSMNAASVMASAEALDGFAVESAALRLPDSEYGQGIRFTISLGNVTLADGATTGILLIPNASLGENELTVDFAHNDLRNVTDIQWKTLKDGTKKAYLHLYDIPASEYATEIAMCAYIDHDANPATAPIYTNTVATSVAEVAQWAYENDSTLSADDLANLQSSYLTYKVFYHNGEEVTEEIGVYGQTLTEIAEPVKIGYTFGGWWNQAGTHEWNFETTTVSSTTTNLYAKWNPATDTAYTVKVQKTTNGGATKEDITATIDGFVSARTGVTASNVDITDEANDLVASLGKGYTLDASASVLTGTIAAEGTTELNIVVNFDEIVAARVGDNANTLIFFDKGFGVDQVRAATGDSYAYTTEKAYGKEDGSLKVTFPGTGAHNTVDLDYKGYEFGANDYVEFYVYNDTDTPTLSLMFGYDHNVKLPAGEWTRVVGDANWITAAKYFRFYGQAANFGSGTNVSGNVYISKVKVGSGFADLSAATSDWVIGETTFTGAVTVHNNNPTSAPTLQKTLYQVGNTVEMHIWDHSYAGFQATLKTPIDATAEDKYVSFTVSGADVNLFTIVAFDPNGKALTGATKACVTRTEENGFITYVFRLAKGDTIGQFRVTPLGNTTGVGTGKNIIISNFTVGNYASLRTGEDANTLFFTDSQLGATLKQLTINAGNNVTSGAYTTEMAYGNEDGSFKAAGIKHGTTAYVSYTLSDADKAFLADTDYVVFYVYSTSSTRWFFSVNYQYTTSGAEIMSNAWTRVIVPAATFKAYNWLLVHPQALAADGTNFDLYFSKFVRYTADEITKLENKAATDTWTLGSTEFVGAPSISNGKTETGYLAGVEHKKAYIVDNELLVTFVRCGDGYINLKLANAMDVAANKDVYITVVMYNYGRLDKLNGYLNSSGSYALSYVSQEDIGGGYAKVTLKCSAKAAAYTISSVRLDVEDHTNEGNGLATQFRIKDIAITF